MNILNLSKRYFWSHLLLGVMAAGLGLSNNITAATSHNTFPAAIFASIKASYAEPSLYRQASLKINQAVFSHSSRKKRYFIVPSLYCSMVIICQSTHLWIAKTLGIRAGPAG